MLQHGLPECRHHVAPHDNILLDFRIPQIQIAILQANSFVRFLAPVDLEGQGVIAAASQHFNLFRHYFDVASIDLGILVVPLTNGAGYGNGALLVQIPNSSHHFLRLDNNLGRAVEVPQHQESQIAADHPDVFHPAGKLHLLADIRQAKLVTGMGTVLHRYCSSFHIVVFLIWSYHERRRQLLPEAPSVPPGSACASASLRRLPPRHPPR